MSHTLLRLRFFDHDIAKVEGLTGLDGEFLAELWTLWDAGWGAIDETIGRAGDQRGEHDPAVGIGRWLFRVVDRIDVNQNRLIGDRGAIFPRFEGREPTGCDDHRDQRPRSESTDRLAVSPDQSGRRRGARLQLDDDRLLASGLAREADGRAQLALRFEEVDGDLGIGVKSVDLETTVAHIAVVPTGPAPRLAMSRVEDDPAEHPGVADGLAIRPDDVACHRRAAAEFRVHFLAADARFQVERDLGV